MHLLHVVAEYVLASTIATFRTGNRMGRVKLEGILLIRVRTGSSTRSAWLAAPSRRYQLATFWIAYCSRSRIVDDAYRNSRRVLLEGTQGTALKPVPRRLPVRGKP